MANNYFDSLSDEEKLKRLNNEKQRIIADMNASTKAAQGVADSDFILWWWNPFWRNSYLMNYAENAVDTKAKKLDEITRMISEIKANQKNNNPNPTPNTTTSPNPTSTTTPTSKPNTGWWTNNRNRTWSNNLSVKQQTPTYVDPNWVVHTWMTQEQFNDSMKMYEKDNEIYNARHAKVWDSETTADELFNNALSKYKADPSSFNDDQSKALWNAWVKLWYWSNDDNESTQSSESSPAPSVAPTVWPTITSNWWWNSIASQVWWRYWEWTDLDRRTQWWQVAIPFSL